MNSPSVVAWGTGVWGFGFQDRCDLHRLAMVPSTHGWLPHVVLCLLIQASIVGGGQVLNRWLAPESLSPCCAPPLVL